MFFAASIRRRSSSLDRCALSLSLVYQTQCSVSSLFSRFFCWIWMDFRLKTEIFRTAQDAALGSTRWDFIRCFLLCFALLSPLYRCSAASFRSLAARWSPLFGILPPFSLLFSRSFVAHFRAHFCPSGGIHPERLGCRRLGGRLRRRFRDAGLAEPEERYGASRYGATFGHSFHSLLT